MLFIRVASSNCFNCGYLKFVPIRDYTIMIVVNTTIVVTFVAKDNGFPYISMISSSKMRATYVTNKEWQRKFGKRVRYLRRDRDMTQEQLAELADLSVNFISQIERGYSSPSLETIIKFANALEVDVGELFKFDVK
jgi:DNA-binding XRE family transcriptional regulator